MLTHHKVRFSRGAGVAAGSRFRRRLRWLAWGSAAGSAAPGAPLGAEWSGWPYNGAMTSTPAPFINPDLIADSPFLCAEDRARITDALLAAHAPGTRKTYAGMWRLWSRWCLERNLTPLPGDPVALCAYLTERAAAGVSTGALSVTCSAISYVHRETGLPSPVHDPTVARVRRGLRRSYGSGTRRPAHPLDTDEIRQIVTEIDRSNPKGARDAALILLGYAAALRPGELATLDLADVTRRPSGLTLRLTAAKTDPERAGQLVAVAAGHHRSACPITALDTWLGFRGTTTGPLFLSLRGRFHPTPDGTRRTTPSATATTFAQRRMISATPSDIVHDRAVAAGLDAARITGHSLRAGHATTAALAGVPIDRIAAQTRHRQIAVLLTRYIRPAQALELTSSQHLGL